MDKVVIKNIIYAASWALFGALGGYYASSLAFKRNLEKNVEEITEDARNSVKLANKRIEEMQARMDIYESAGLSFKTAQMIADRNKKSVEKTEEKLFGKKAYDELVRPIVDPHDPFKPAHFNYSKLEANDVGSSDDGEVEDMTPSETVDQEEPYMISAEEFSESHDEYRKVSCCYYTEDRVLCETSHSEIIDIRHVGQDTIDLFDNSDLELIYVRNDYLGIDYEIDKYFGNYSYEVLGEEQLEE